jgi:hypothetical protein
MGALEAGMNIARIFAVAVTLGVLSTASSQETQKPAAPAAAKPAADAPAGATSQPGGGSAPAQAGSPAAPSSGAAAAQEAQVVPLPPSAATPKTGVVKDNEFIPTEEIQPDEPVTFPVDI